MRLLRWFVIGVALALSTPPPMRAQTVAPADLVGTWVSTMVYKDPKGATTKSEEFWTFGADRTWKHTFKQNGADMPKSETGGRWYLSSDSLWLGEPVAVDTVFDTDFGGRIVLKNQALKVVLLEDKLYLPTYENLLQLQAKAQREGRTLTPKETVQNATAYQRVP